MKLISFAVFALLAPACVVRSVREVIQPDNKCGKLTVYNQNDRMKFTVNSEGFNKEYKVKYANREKYKTGDRDMSFRERSNYTRCYQSGNGNVLFRPIDSKVRGWYVSFSEDNLVGISKRVSISAIDHNGKPIEKYDRYHFKYTDKDGTKKVANVIRGAKELYITLHGAGSNAIQDKVILPEIQFEIALEPYIFKRGLFVFIVFLGVSQVGLFVNTAWTASQVNEDDDDYDKFEDGSSSDSSESENKKKLILKLALGAVIHNLDTFTDIWYLLYVPIPENHYEYSLRYSDNEWVKSPNFGVKDMLFYSLVIPNALMVAFYFCQRCVKCRECNLTCISDLVLEWTQTKNLVELIKSGTAATFKNEQNTIFTLLFLAEDVFQFYFQLKNSLFIGKSWEYLQVLGLFLSMKGVATRFTKIAHQDKGYSIAKVSKVTLNLIVQGIFAYLMYKLVVEKFEFQDNRPMWAQIFPLIRMNLGEDPYPRIE